MNKLMSMFFVLLIFSSTVLAEVKPDQVAEAFCAAEMNADFESRALVIDVKRALRTEIAKEKKPMRAEMIDYSSEPVIVIKTCKLASIIVNNNSAVAVLSSHRLAIAKGEGGNPNDKPRRFIRDENKEDKTEINLELVNGEWKIVFPPFPRVGIDALIKLIEEEIVSSEKIYIENGKPVFQKTIIDFDKSELNFLKSLR